MGDDLVPGEWHGTPLYADGRPTVAGRAARKFSWQKALWTCLKVSAITGVISFLIELMVGILAFRSVSAGHVTTLARIWILAALFIPVCVSTFIVGYRVGAFGWAVAGITVALTYLVFRVGYAMIVIYVFSGGQFHFINPFTPLFLGTVLLIYCPVGMLFGYLGELRATTGLGF
jgi:putative effector of murein hydrolase LrgA (UPF0299 family)